MGGSGCKPRSRPLPLQLSTWSRYDDHPERPTIERARTNACCTFSATSPASRAAISRGSTEWPAIGGATKTRYPQPVRAGATSRASSCGPARQIQERFLVLIRSPRASLGLEHVKCDSAIGIVSAVEQRKLSTVSVEQFIAPGQLVDSIPRLISSGLMPISRAIVVATARFGPKHGNPRIC